METRSRFVIAPNDLQHLIETGTPDLRIIDASWYLPAQGRNARAEYDTAHIPGAVFFDQDEIVDPHSSLPHALPTPSVFAAHMGAMGIAHSDRIVIYDGPGMFTAPRIWWMLRAMGAGDVMILDGGFDRWKAAARPVSSVPAAVRPATFDARLDVAQLATLEDMRAIVADRSMQIADARSSGRFSGAEPEPRPGMRSGHMPGALNVPVFSLSEDGRLKTLAGLRQTLEDAGLDLSQPVVTTCGSGVTAAVINLALASLGHDEMKLYDGSWSQWGTLTDTPVETGLSASHPATARAGSQV